MVITGKVVIFMDITKFNLYRSSIEMPREQIIHDLALLIVKSKMENHSITTLGQIFETYASEVHGMKRVVEEYLD
ncbi:MAG: hypothetical protein K0Q87_80 [Neobacillus sp.]|jgi:hypothetical protein|nr:hypothetical protein [Neobacillus sp.]